MATTTTTTTPATAATALSPDDTASLLAWIDAIPLSRPKRNLNRDFSDGVATAEVIHHFCPKLVDLHNYSPAHSVAQKMYNWSTLNQKVFRKLGFTTTREAMAGIVANRAGCVESLLWELRGKLDHYLARRRPSSSSARPWSIGSPVPPPVAAVAGGKPVPPPLLPLKPVPAVAAVPRAPPAVPLAP
ncbi:hypothetical protein DFJ73DRAFT_663264, partial [Zopfochytrium polystomum]